jgi:hypothetical protein
MPRQKSNIEKKRVHITVDPTILDICMEQAKKERRALSSQIEIILEQHLIKTSALKT